MELISKEELRDKMYHEAFEVDSELQKWDSGCWIRYKLFEKILDEVLTVESRPHGEWIDNYSARNEEGFWRCSVCGREIYLYNSTEKERTEKYPYCHCGAYMGSEE